MDIAIPRISKKFKIFPIPKYRSIRNSVSPVAKRVPRRVWAKRREKVKSKARNTKKKNIGKIPEASGSTK